MGDYNQDENFNMPRMANLARTKNLFSDLFVRSDLWSIDSARQVASFNDGGLQFRCKVLFDPRQILDSASSFS